MSFLSAILPVAKGNVGDLVRYDAGPTALMRVTNIIGGRYYGRAFHSEGTCTSRSEVFEPSEEDREAWRRCHNPDDTWIRGAYAASADRSPKGEKPQALNAEHESAIDAVGSETHNNISCTVSNCYICHHSSTTPGEE